MWHVEFSDGGTTAEKRNRALNRLLKSCYETYRDAFTLDLNHYYSGLVAFQMGTILLDFASLDHWKSLFNSEKEAKDYKSALKNQLAAYGYVIPMSIQSAMTHSSEASKDQAERSKDQIWHNVSKADFLFLVEQKDHHRVINAYQDAVIKNPPFVWNAAKGQLALFAELGVRAELAEKVLATVGKLVDPVKPKKPVDVIVFAGHRIDLPNRIPPRFPQNKEDTAKRLIMESLEKILDPTHETVVLASAAAGSDILMHEICIAKNLSSLVCLPMPVKQFAPVAFANQDLWRNRFLDVLDKRKDNILVLSDREGLPRWLQGKDIDEWERGNKWVLNMALAWGANRITLLALWDGQETSTPPGGTAHVVKLAREYGNIRIEQIDSRRLATS